MSDLKLFRIQGQIVAELPSKTSALEKSLQIVLEKNLEALLGIRFLKTEYSTGKTHGGRIDTLGIDENASPVIIEYKRAVNENVISQGLYYLDWLLDHKAEFQLIVLEKLGNQVANELYWEAPRLVCVAADFTKYDQHAVRQIDRDIDLVRYRHFGDDLLALDLVYRNNESEKSWKQASDKGSAQSWDEPGMPMGDIYEELRAYLLALGDDVSEKQLKVYSAYRRIKNFVCIVVQKNALVVYLKLNPDDVPIEYGFTRDVRNIGHWATGDLEITIKNLDDLRRAEPLIRRSYDGG